VGIPSFSKEAQILLIDLNGESPGFDNAEQRSRIAGIGIIFDTLPFSILIYEFILLVISSILIFCLNYMG
jgi:hypothetical protein